MMTEICCQIKYVLYSVWYECCSGLDLSVFFFLLEYSPMDTPESPTQSPLSPEEEEKGFSNSELLHSPDEDGDRVISDSELLQEDENESLVEEVAVENQERDSELGDEVVPDFVSDAEDEESIGETGGMEQEDETIVLMEGDEDVPQPEQLDEEEDRVIDTPQSPDSELGQMRSLTEPGEDGEEEYDDYRNDISAREEAAGVDDDEEEDDKNKEEEERRDEERRRAVAAREMKDDSASVARELDEHELDYDEDVPEERSIPAQEEDEEEAKVEGEVEEEEQSEDKSSKKKEKKPILPPSPQAGETRRKDDLKGSERIRRDSFRDKKKDEDDGEIDEGEIDVSDCALASFIIFELIEYRISHIQNFQSSSFVWNMRWQQHEIFAVAENISFKAQ